MLIGEMIILAALSKNRCEVDIVFQIALNKVKKEISVAWSSTQ